MADLMKEAVVVLVAVVDLAVAATLVAIVLLVWSDVQEAKSRLTCGIEDAHAAINPNLVLEI